MAETDRYKYDYTSVKNCFDQNVDLRILLDNSYEKSLGFFNSMVDSELWKGQAYKEFMGFYHLVLQYHAWLSGNTMPSYLDSAACTNVDYDCQLEMRNAWETLMYNLLDFAGDSSHYKSLEDIN